jgi:multidrug efflux system outer membrane protein
MEISHMNQSLKSRYLSCAALLVTMTTLIGCTVGPNYKRPTVDVPVTYRGTPSESSSSSGTDPQPQQAKDGQQAAQSLGDAKWWEVFQDRELQNLIRTALKNNYDVRIAATRVLEAQA